MSSHVPVQLCKKIWAHQYPINTALLLKGNLELQDLCSGGVFNITEKDQTVLRPKMIKEQDLSLYRIDCLSVPCPSHKKLLT